MEESKPRFHPITEEYINEINNTKVSRNSVYAQKNWMRIFDAWADEQQPQRKHCLDLTPEELAKEMPEFILGARTRTGRQYSPHSLPAMVSAIFRGYNQEKKTTLNFYKDALFCDVLRILDSYIHQLQSEGFVGKSVALPLTSKMRKAMYASEYFSRKNGKGLVRLVYLAMTEQLGERISYYTNLTMGRVQITVSEKLGSDYIRIPGLPDKNHTGGLRALQSEESWEKNLFESDNPEYCVVEIIKLYLSHLPTGRQANTRFFLQPLKNPKGDVWYSLNPIGVGTIGT